MADPTEMELRVAKAIMESPYVDYSDPASFLPHARVAIRAMREPTEAMLEEQQKYDGNCVAWEAMIDAASPP